MTDSPSTSRTGEPRTAGRRRHYARVWYGFAYPTEVHSFRSRKERDAWCEGGAAYAGMPSCREAIPANHEDIRRLKEVRAHPILRRNYNVEMHEH